MDQFQKIVMRLPERDATKTIQRLIKDYNINIAGKIPLYCDEHNKFIGYLYITNNYLGQEGTCIICTEFFVEHFGKVYHQWNEKIFLDSLGGRAKFKVNDFETKRTFIEWLKKISYIN
jgi:hypothetical protein